MKRPPIWRDEDGAALVEYALVLPALLALAFGLMQLGGMAWTQEALNYAVQEAARCAVVRVMPRSPCCWRAACSWCRRPRAIKRPKRPA